MNSIPEDDAAVEGQAWLRAIPLHEFVYGMIVRSLATLGCQTVQHSRLGLSKIRQRQYSLWRFLLLSRSRHRRRPPLTVAVRMSPTLTTAAFVRRNPPAAAGGVRERCRRISGKRPCRSARGTQIPVLRSVRESNRFSTPPGRGASSTAALLTYLKGQM
jgi:hypothetical protein